MKHLLTNKKIRFSKGTRGQAMVEFAVAAPVFVLFLYACLYVSDLYIYKQKAVIAARYGAWRLSRGMTQGNIPGNFFEGDSANVTTFHENIEAEGAIDELAGFMDDVFGDDDVQGTYHFNVKYKVSSEFGPFDLSDISGAPDFFNLTSDHYVNAGTWDGCHSDVHEMYGMLKNIVKSAFEDIFKMKDDAENDDSDMPDE